MKLEDIMLGEIARHKRTKLYDSICRRYRDYEFRSLREILFSLGEKKDLLTGRWNLSTALGNRSDLQMLSLTALRRGNVFFCFVLFNKRLQSSNVK